MAIALGMDICVCVLRDNRTAVDKLHRNASAAHGNTTSTFEYRTVSTGLIS